ncbi:MAG: hypothetical protein XXXJIFNMEKO3_01667 [Candidatus Erwinia impunctatus]|nr:hypothetical protein XXXJIFNMEKO_01667 [Culicoides impunctatus]
MKEPLYLIGNGQYPGKEIVLTHLAEMNLYLPAAHHALRQRIDELFALRHLPLHIIGEIESLETLTAALSGGNGVSIVPESAALALQNAGKVWASRITSPHVNLHYTLNVSASRVLSAQARSVKNLLVSQIRKPMIMDRELLLVS